MGAKQPYKHAKKASLVISRQHSAIVNDDQAGGMSAGVSPLPLKQRTSLQKMTNA